MPKKRILIIDDEASVTRLLKLNLEQTGAYEVREEHQGTRGLAAAREFQPDLILLDVTMPDLDGREVAAQIQADGRTKDTPIVFLTAVAAKKGAGARGGSMGGHPCLTKPVTIEDVISCIEQDLRKSDGCDIQKKTILIIDDDESVCRMLKLNLEHEHECLIATSGEEGIELVKRRKPDLVLLDIVMPGIDGIETLKRIKEVDKDMPVCMVTAALNEPEAKRCFAAGAYEYIAKPVDLDYLNVAVLVKLLS